MARLFAVPLLASLSLFVTSPTASAAHYYGPATRTVVVSTRYSTFGGGVYYRGLHHHWSACRFDPTWRTFYWYSTRASCLPVSAIASYPPQFGP